MQYARPSIDISLGSWTEDDDTTDALYEEINETPADDGDYVKVVGADSTYEVRLTSVTDPTIHTGHVVNFRMYGTGAGAPEKLTVDLVDNTTVIATLANQQSDGAWGNKQIVVAEAEAANISDYGNLRLRLSSTGNTGGSDEVRCSFAEFVCPDVSVGAQIMNQFQGSNLGADLYNGAII